MEDFVHAKEKSFGLLQHVSLREKEEKVSDSTRQKRKVLKNILFETENTPVSMSLLE